MAAFGAAAGDAFMDDVPFPNCGSNLRTTEIDIGHLLFGQD